MRALHRGTQAGAATRPRARRAPLTAAHVADLRAAAARFGPAAREAKATLLAALAARTLTRPRIVAAYHDALLFVVAHADDAGVAALAEDELRRCADAVRALGEAAGAPVLPDTGIAWTEHTAALSFDLARWLARRFPGGAEITSFGDGAQHLQPLLALLLPPAEGDSVAADDDPLALLDRLKGPADTRLRFLVAALERLAAPDAARGALYDALTAFVTIAPRGSSASRTFARGLPAPRFHQREPLAKAVPDPLAVIARPLPAARPLSSAARTALVDVARATLAMLARETDPITWPSVGAVALHELDRGLAIATFPMHRSRRPALDSHTGYLVFRNRVPIAYGGGWPFLRTCRIGINVFPAFRGGESALAFAQVLRVYRHLFDAGRFVVEPYQFGAGNAEGLRSGAFWFYWRLGFRPGEPAVARAAAREAARLARARAARTPLAVMRDLAASDLALDLHPLAAEQRVEAGEVSLAVTRRIVAAHGGDRGAAERDALARVRGALRVTGESGWPAAERRAFRALAPVVALADDLERWPDDDKAACLALMRAKGADDDRDYFLRLARHPRLPGALLAATRR